MSVRHLNADASAAIPAEEFIQLCRLLAGARGDVGLAGRIAEQRQLSTLATIFRSAVSAGSLSDPNFAAAIAEYPGIVSAFLDSLRNSSAFDRLMPDMKRVPLRSRAVVATAGAVGYVVGEGQMKVLSALQLSGSLIDPVKVVCAVVMSDELWRSTDASALALFSRELRSAVASQTDTQFVNQITTNANPIASSGSTTTAVRTDLSNALRSMDTDAASQMYILVSSKTAKSLCFLDSDGPPAFADVSPLGGAIQGIPLLVSDGVSDGTLIVLDANAVAAGSDMVTLDVSNEADVMMSSTPDSPVVASSVMQSLWQHGQTALRAERWIAAELLRPTGVAVISNAHYGLGDSP